MANDAGEPGSLDFCDSDGNCTINLGFVPETMVIDADGNYVATSKTGETVEGIVPYAK